MRLSDQRILGYYDATPRTKMIKQQFGSLDAASKATEHIMELPGDIATEEIDPDSPELSEAQHAHIHMQESEDFCDEFDLDVNVNKRPADTADDTAPALKRSRPNPWHIPTDTMPASGGTAASAQASGGTATMPASGGTATSAQASGGNATMPASGGTATSAQASGGSVT
jgi:hypothetical protein